MWQIKIVAEETPPVQYDKNNLRECGGEYYWITDRSDLDYPAALQHCQQNSMVLATPYTSARKNCFQPVMQGRGITKAWIDYKLVFTLGID